MSTRKRSLRSGRAASARGAAPDPLDQLETLVGSVKSACVGEPDARELAFECRARVEGVALSLLCAADAMTTLAAELVAVAETKTWKEIGAGLFTWPDVLRHILLYLGTADRKNLRMTCSAALDIMYRLDEHKTAISMRPRSVLDLQVFAKTAQDLARKAPSAFASKTLRRVELILDSAISVPVLAKDKSLLQNVVSALLMIRAPLATRFVLHHSISSYAFAGVKLAVRSGVFVTEVVRTATTPSLFDYGTMSHADVRLSGNNKINDSVAAWLLNTLTNPMSAPRLEELRSSDDFFDVLDQYGIAGHLGNVKDSRLVLHSKFPDVVVPARIKYMAAVMGSFAKLVLRLPPAMLTQAKAYTFVWYAASVMPSYPASDVRQQIFIVVDLGGTNLLPLGVMSHLAEHADLFLALDGMRRIDDPMLFDVTNAKAGVKIGVARVLTGRTVPAIIREPCGVDELVAAFPSLCASAPRRH